MFPQFTEVISGTLKVEDFDQSKLDLAMRMINKTSLYLVADYVLVDSWFTCERLIGVVRSLNEGTMHLIGMMKMAKAKSISSQGIHSPTVIKQEKS